MGVLEVAQTCMRTMCFKLIRDIPNIYSFMIIYSSYHPSFSLLSSLSNYLYFSNHLFGNIVMLTIKYLKKGKKRKIVFWDAKEI